MIANIGIGIIMGVVFGVAYLKLNGIKKQK